ncbi:MAG: uracil phosphoribosyltransferase [Oscillospiraceae bacterium]|nr:uracil phosphoribosyltransferase [Oscillospiraceae bacterium]
MAVHILDHPLIHHKLAILRSKDTGVKEFRELVGEIAGLMCFEATRNLPTVEVEIETPVATAKCRMLSGKKLAIVPVLRAGLGMVDKMVDLIPSAKIGHIGLYRDPDTHQPVEYYCKLPEDIESRQVYVVDPMLATGGSAIAAIDFLKQRGCKNIIMMNIIGCPEGVKAVQDAHPDVELYLAAVDERLNDHAYIIPGLGDAGDRIFGTK